MRVSSLLHLFLLLLAVTLQTASGKQNIYGWGWNLYSVLGNGDQFLFKTPQEFTPGGSKFIDIKTGNNFHVAVTEDGYVVAWGSNQYGQLGDGTQNTAIIPIVLGPAVFGGEKIKQVSAGFDFTVALTVSGKVYTWGGNDYTQLGTGYCIPVITPTLHVSSEMANKTIVKISAQDFQSIALADDGTVFTMGANRYGQRGSGEINDAFECKGAVPTVLTKEAMFGKTIVDVVSGQQFFIILTSSGEVITWGRNTNGQLGINSAASYKATPSLIPTSAFGGNTIKAVAAGLSHAMVLSNDLQLWTWGKNDNGQLGDGSLVNRKAPVKVANFTTGPFNIKGIFSMRDNNFVYSDNYVFYGCGRNSNSRIRPIESTERTPVLTPMVTNAFKGKSIKTITADTSHTAALADDGTMFYWGNNDKQLFGKSTLVLTPVKGSSDKLFGGSSLATISFGVEHALGLTETGELYVWGSNGDAFYEGPLGTGLNEPSPTPVKISAFGGQKIVKAAAGGYHSMVLAENGTIFAWGSNSYYQIGDGTKTNVYTPKAISQDYFNNKKMIDIAGGYYHSTALTEDGLVYAWGQNSYNQIGIDGLAYSPTPIQLPFSSFGQKSIKAIYASYNINYAQAVDSSIYAWGLTTEGQLGDGTTDPKTTPVLSTSLQPYHIEKLSVTGFTTIALLKNGSVIELGRKVLVSYGTPEINIIDQRNFNNKKIVDVCAGDAHAVAVADDGSVFVWGSNEFGQLGNGTTSTNNPGFYSMPASAFNGNSIVKVFAGYSWSMAISSVHTVDIVAAGSYVAPWNLLMILLVSITLLLVHL